MNNGMSSSGEDAVRAAVRRARTQLAALDRALQTEAWDYQTLEAIFHTLGNDMAFVANAIQRGIIMLAANQQFERLLGLALPPDLQARLGAPDGDIPSAFNKIDIQAYLRRIREERDHDKPDNDA